MTLPTAVSVGVVVCRVTVLILSAVLSPPGSVVVVVVTVIGTLQAGVC